VILRSLVLTQYQRMTDGQEDGQTDIQTDIDVAYLSRALALSSALIL